MRIIYFYLKKIKEKNDCKKLTSLSFIENMVALACSAAFPTSGSNMTLINVTSIFNVVDASIEKFIKQKALAKWPHIEKHKDKGQERRQWTWLNRRQNQN